MAEAWKEPKSIHLTIKVNIDEALFRAVAALPPDPVMGDGCPARTSREWRQLNAAIQDAVGQAAFASMNDILATEYAPGAPPPPPKPKVREFTPEPGWLAKDIERAEAVPLPLAQRRDYEECLACQ